MIFILPTNTCFGIACPISEKESYEKVYEIKKRDKKKAIAIMVDNFSYFSEYTKLTKKQINFLKNYENPFTILIDKSKILDKKLLKNINNLDNSEIYEKIAFRVAHLKIHTELINNYGPLFLTSANKSNNPEIFNIENILNEFKNKKKKYNIKIILGDNKRIKSEKEYSDIFEFDGESEDIKYFRK